MNVVELEDVFLDLAKVVNDDAALLNLSSAQVELVKEHGFAGLLYQRVEGLSQSESKVLKGSIKTWRKIALINEATALVRYEAVEALLRLAKKHDVQVLLMKGLALSYQVYPTPGCRPSSDVDILVNEKDLDTIKLIFVELGYRLENSTEKSLLSFQFSALQDSDTGHTLVFDIHYRISNSSQYERYFDFDSLYEKSTVIPQFDDIQAKGLSVADAYTFACVHLQGHLMQGDPIKPIWLYDIHLLINKLSEENHSQIVKQFECFDSHDLGSICRYWSDMVCQYFKTQMYEELRVTLSRYPDITDKQRSNPVMLLWSQAKYLPDNRAKLKFLKQLFIPAATRIKQKYPGSKVWLPLLYLRRILDGFLSRVSKIGK